MIAHGHPPTELSLNELAAVQALRDGRVLDLGQRPNNEILGPFIRALIRNPSDFGVEQVTALRLSGAKVAGRLNLGSLSIPFPVAFIRCDFTHPLVLTKARCLNIDLRGSTMPALRAASLTVDQTLALDDGFQSRGQVRLTHADLGQLNAEHALIDNPDGYSLAADYLRVRGFATLEQATLSGTVRLLGARIDGQLDLTNAAVAAWEGDDSITLDTAAIQGGVFFASAHLQGCVNLNSARVDNEVSFKRATLVNPEEVAVEASNCSARALNFTEASVRGEARLRNVRVNVLDCTRTRFDDGATSSLDLDGATISGAFHAMFDDIGGKLDLTNAAIDNYRDTKTSWPKSLVLTGTKFGRLEGDELHGAPQHSRRQFRHRLHWLSRDDRSVDKFAAIAATYRETGQPRLQRAALIAGEHARRMAGRRGVAAAVAWSASTVIRLLIGYGYSPARALLPLLGLIMAGTVFAQWAYGLGLIEPASKVATTPFNAFRYTVAILFPVARLADADGFVATAWMAWLAFGLSLAGWFLAAVVVAGLAGIFKRQ